MGKEYQQLRLKDFIQFNPKEKLAKGSIARKITMEHIVPYNRYVYSNTFEEYKGGSKFRNGDTIMARITPCLENGKTAYVSSLDQNELAFGSTEFIVLREISDVSDKKYIYYLISTPEIRNIAIKSMVGSSGRQRVQQNVLENYIVCLPSLKEQRRIANILSSLDDKIELNRRINENLEQQAQALFNNMFGSQIDNLIETPYCLGDLVNCIDNRGKTPMLSSNKTDFPIIDVKALSGKSRIINYENCTKYVSEETYNTWFRSGHPTTLDILMSTVGSLAELKIFLGTKGCIAQNVIGLRAKNISALYLYQYLFYVKDKLLTYNIGSVQPSIKVTHIIKYPIFVPSENELRKFDEAAKHITHQIYTLNEQIVYLSNIRDSLLPKLMSGELQI